MHRVRGVVDLHEFGGEMALELDSAGKLQPMSDESIPSKPTEDTPIEFFLGSGNHSVICGATTPVATLDLDREDDDADGATG